MQRYVDGLHRALTHLHILNPGHSVAAPAVTTLDTVDAPPALWGGAENGDADKASSGHLQSQNITPVAGIWRAAVDLWDGVTAGQKIGTVSTHFGSTVFELRANKSGTVGRYHPLPTGRACPRQSHRSDVNVGALAGRSSPTPGSGGRGGLFGGGRIVHWLHTR